MKFNFKGWKKIHEADDHTVLSSHDGHQVKIAHKAISPKIRQQLAKLELAQTKAEGGEITNLGKKVHVVKGFNEPSESTKKDKGPYINQEKAQANAEDAKKSGVQTADWENAKNEVKKLFGYADGGEAQPLDIEQVSPEEINQVAPEQKPLDVQPVSKQEMQNVTNLPPQIAAQAQQSSVPLEKPNKLQIEPVSDTEIKQINTPDKEINERIETTKFVPEEQDPTMRSGFNKEIQGLQKQAEAESTLAQKQAHHLEAMQKIQDQKMLEFQKSQDELRKQIDLTEQDIRNGHIDPKNYWDNHSKIWTAIGLILGGPQAAVNLHHAMERDLEAQKANLGQKHTLLSALYQKSHDLNSAMDQARVMQAERVSNMLKIEALKSQDPIVKAKYLQAAGKVEQDAAPAFQRAALAKMAQDAAQMNNIDRQIEILEAVDPEKAKSIRSRYVPGMGLALTEKDAGTVKELKATVDNAKSGINELLAIQALPNKSLDLETRAKADTIAQSLVGLLRVPLTGPGAMSEGERKLIENIVANPTSIFSLDNTNKIRLQTLSRRLDKGLESTARAVGIQVMSPEDKLNPQQKQFLDWARKNPNDPRSQMIIKKLNID